MAQGCTEPASSATLRHRARHRRSLSEATMAKGKAVFEALEGLIPGQLKAAGKFTVPGLTMIKLKKKKATKAGKRLMFGEMKHIKAKPAKTIVKCYTVKALKDEF